MFPIESMPQGMQLFTTILPMRYFLVIVRGIMMKGLGLVDLWDQVIPLAALGASTLAEVVVERGKPRGGARTVRVTQGDTVSLRVRSDEGLPVHIHGYDIELGVPAGASASVDFSAKIVGRFPVTAHLHAADGKKGSEPTLLYLEVHPR